MTRNARGRAGVGSCSRSRPWMLRQRSPAALKRCVDDHRACPPPRYAAASAVAVFLDPTAWPQPRGLRLIGSAKPHEHSFHRAYLAFDGGSVVAPATLETTVSSPFALPAFLGLPTLSNAAAPRPRTRTTHPWLFVCVNYFPLCDSQTRRAHSNNHEKVGWTECHQRIRATFTLPHDTQEAVHPFCSMRACLL
jgi:hypothetical protein